LQKVGRKMATIARALTTHEAFAPDWETVREWSKATLTRERMAEAGVVAATLVVTGKNVNGDRGLYNEDKNECSDCSDCSDLVSVCLL
jgi:hypothetical protein